MAETWTTIKTKLKAYFDTLYDAVGTASGKIASSISDGDTTHAPDGNSVFDALALKADVASPVFTGHLNTSTLGAGDACYLYMTRTAGQNVGLNLRTGGVNRWLIYANSTAESGGDAGTDFALQAFTDAGVSLGLAFVVKRSNKHVGIGVDSPVQRLDVRGGRANFRPVNEQYGVGVGYSATSGLVYFGADAESATPNAVISNAAGVTIATFNTSTYVGIGTTAPARRLVLYEDTTVFFALQNSTTGIGPTDGFQLIQDSGNAYAWEYENNPIIFGTNNTDRGRFQADGHLKILNNLIIGTAGNGIDFSVNANAAGMAGELLNDYETGTWTLGIAFGGNSVGITYNATYVTGYYEKIGDFVFITGYCILTNKGSSTGNATITGLPFTITNSGAAYSAPSLRCTFISFADFLEGYLAINTTTIFLEECTNAGNLTNITNADFANTSTIIVSAMYRAG